MGGGGQPGGEQPYHREKEWNEASMVSLHVIDAILPVSLSFPFPLSLSLWPTLSLLLRLSLSQPIRGQDLGGARNGGRCTAFATSWGSAVDLQELSRCEHIRHCVGGGETISV